MIYLEDHPSNTRPPQCVLEQQMCFLSKFMAICFIISLLMHIGAISTDIVDAQSCGAGVFRDVRFK